MHFLSVSPFLSISSQGKNTKPSSSASKRFIRSCVSFAGKVFAGLSVILSSSEKHIPASVVFDIINLKSGFLASSKYLSKSSYGFTHLEITSICFVSTPSTPRQIWVYLHPCAESKSHMPSGIGWTTTTLPSKSVSSFNLCIIQSAKPRRNPPSPNCIIFSFIVVVLYLLLDRLQSLGIYAGSLLQP